MTEQKEKPSEVEQQLKKAEAAQRRRMQNEKAALESQVCLFPDVICCVFVIHLSLVSNAKSNNLGFSEGGNKENTGSRFQSEEARG